MRAGGWARAAVAASACLVVGVVFSWLMLVLLLHAPPAHARLALVYLLASAVVSLALGAALLALVWRSVPSLGVKIWTACITGSVATMVVVLYTPYMMFSTRADFELLRITLVYAVFITLALGVILATLITRRLAVLAVSAGSVAAGRFDTRVPEHGSDELAALARSFNSMARELGDLFARKQQLENGRRDLIAAVSHDLRTPLASIRAMVEAINDGVVDDPREVRRYLRVIQGEAEQLSQLIDDLFELSRIESGSLELRLATAPLTELVADTVEGLRIQAEERGIELRAVYDDRLPPLAIDAPRMQRVLVNLIGNALRHTPPGGHVRVEVSERSGHVELAVVDDGEGITLDDQPMVFDQFFRGERSRSRESGGTGLGLAIARGIVEAHRGTISVKSAPGKGATFLVTL